MHDDARDNHNQMIERAEITNLVRSRMDSLNLPPIDYDDVSEKRSSLSYVIINPSCDLKLEEGDIMWVDLENLQRVGESKTLGFNKIVFRKSIIV